MSNTISSPGRTPSTKTRVRWLLLGATLLAVALVLSGSQCAKTSDRILTPSPLGALTEGISECVEVCVEEAKADRTEEQARHRNAVMACEEDPQCLEDEEALHTGIMEAIAMAFQECHSGCHNQGGGEGGQ